MQKPNENIRTLSTSSQALRRGMPDCQVPEGHKYSLASRFFESRAKHIQLQPTDLDSCKSDIYSTIVS